MVNSYSGILVIKKNEILPFAWVDLEVLILRGVNQKEKGTRPVMSLICRR